MKPKPQIVDRGRGPQLAHRRTTVLNLVPLFQQSASTDEILEIFSLEPEDIEVARDYYHSHRTEMDELDRRATEYFDRQRKAQEERFPSPPADSTLEERVARIRKLYASDRAARNGH